MAALTPLFVNGWKSTVQAGSTAIGSSTATGINVATGDGAALGTIGTNQFIPMVVVDSSGTIKEYVWATARSTDALTVTRQAEDSSRFAASTTSIQSGYSIYAIATANGLYQSLNGFVGPRRHSYLAWNGDPFFGDGGAFNGNGSTLYLTWVPTPMPVTVTNICVYVTTAGGGLANCYGGLYDTSGNLLRSTADQSTAWGSTGLMTMALTSSVNLSGGADAGVYAGLQFGTFGATRPVFLSLFPPTGSRFPNMNLTASTARCVAVTTGNAALPSTVTLSGGALSNACHWWAFS